MTDELIAVKSVIERRREVLTRPEVKEVLSPAEFAIYAASLKRPFSQYSDSDFGMYLSKALRSVSKDIGYTAGGENDFIYLVGRMAEIIRRHYWDLTLSDFLLAFELCITGELDEYLPKRRDGIADRGHYQQFNAEYICKVLNAYRLRRAAVMRKALESVPEQEKPEEAGTIARLTERAGEIFLEVLNYYRDYGCFPSGMTAITEIICCDVLSKAGLMPQIEVTEAEQKEVLQRVLNQYARQGEVGSMERLKAEGVRASEIQPKAYISARKKALAGAIERIIKENIKIEL